MSVWKIGGVLLGIIATILFSFVFSEAQEASVVSWNDFGPDELRSQLIEVTRPTLVTVQGAGIKVEWSESRDEGRYTRDNTLAYGWILDLETRQPVWSMAREMNPSRLRSNAIMRVERKVSLPAGKYAVYYFCGIGKGESWHFDFDGDDEGFLGGLKRIFNDKNNSYRISEKDRRKLYFTVTAERGSYRALAADPFESRAVLSITTPRNSSFKSHVFRLSEPAILTVYAIGEYDQSARQMADGGYIQDLRSRKKVWELDYRGSEHAGGAEKNRKFFGKVSLPAGEYQLVYATDDSHTFGRWNAAPPYDPEFWGVTVLTDGDARKKILPVEPSKEPVVVQFLRVGDNELLSSGFSLDRAMDLRVYCIGEYSDGDHSFADYGLIENASSGKRAWDMTYGSTEPAGGAEKNRMFDGIVHFPPGDYVVRYVTDGSHSYNHWNSTAPYDQEHWGIVVAGIPGSFDSKAVRPFSGEARSKNVLVKMVGLRDDDEQEQRFRLTKTTSLRIYAIGEGGRDEMYDYGWIENNESGRTVWEMTWRNTLPAGGASKNRMFDDVVILPPGSYTVRYKTDGSHSTGDWNAAPPRDPFNWGITISLAQ
jgi:hypothetical protein